MNGVDPVKKFLLYGFMFLVVVVVVVGALGDGEDTGTKVASSSSSPSDQEQESSQNKNQVEKHKIGDTISIDGLEITLNKVRKGAGGQFNKPQEDMFLYTMVTIENKSDKSQRVSSLGNFELADSEGIRYTIALTTDSKGKVDGEISPGQKLKGELAFDVPESDSYELIRKEIFENGQVIWKFDKNEIE